MSHLETVFAEATPNNKDTVEASRRLIDAYCLLAESMGVTALGITSPKEAVAEFKAFKPSFVFLDIGMPDIDGYELVKMLKALPESENVKFYSQSGWGSERCLLPQRKS